MTPGFISRWLAQRKERRRLAAWEGWRGKMPDHRIAFGIVRGESPPHFYIPSAEGTMNFPPSGEQVPAKGNDLDD